MPYEIETKDGIVIRGIPDDVKPDSFELKAKVANARQARMAQEGVSGGALMQAGIDPTEGMSGTDKFLAGTGKAMVDTGRGLSQIGDMAMDAIAPRRAGLSSLITGQQPKSRLDESQAALAQSRAQDEPLMNTGAGIGGNIAGNIGMALAPGGIAKGAGIAARAVGMGGAADALSAGGNLLMAPKTIPQALAVGGGMGAVQPAVDMQERAMNAGIGAGATAIVPAAGRAWNAAKSAVEPLYEGGQNAIIGRALNRAAGDDAPQAMQRMALGRGLVQGSEPTAAEVAGNPGIAAMQRAASAIEPQAYGQRAIDQNFARAEAVRGIGGAEGEKASLEASRSGAANRLYEKAYEKGIDLSRFDSGKSPFALAEALKKGEPAAADTSQSLIGAINKMGGIKNAGGTMRDIIGESRAGAGVKGVPPGLFHQNGRGLDELATGLRERGYLIADDAADGGVADLKNMIREELEGVQKHYSAVDQQKVWERAAAARAGKPMPEPPKNLTRANDKIEKLLERPALKDAVAQARVLAANEGASLETPAGSVKGLDYVKRALDDQIGAAEGNQKRVLTQLKSDLLEHIDEISPDYAKARTTFAEMSKPINAMEVGRALSAKLEPALMAGSSSPTGQNAAAFAKALRDGDQTAARATGFKGSTLENTLAPDQMATLGNVRDDLQRSAYAKDAGRGVGSDTIQKLSQSNMLEQAGIPNFLRNLSIPQIGGSLLSRGADVIYSPANKKMSERLAQALLNPQEAAQMMRHGTPSERAALAAELMRRIGGPAGMAAPAISNAQQQQ